MQRVQVASRTLYAGSAEPFCCTLSGCNWVQEGATVTAGHPLAGDPLYLQGGHASLSAGGVGVIPPEKEHVRRHGWNGRSLHAPDATRPVPWRGHDSHAHVPQPLGRPMPL